MSLVFDIKRYSINDGPGIRITIFLKGCPLSCVWCHNPEGVAPEKEKLYTKKRCIGCSSCVMRCPEKALKLTPDGIITDRALCTLCGACAEVCPTDAIEISGAVYTVDYLMNEIEKETVFMDSSGGGVTFCGGEPLMHPDLLTELLQRCGQLHIHRAVDTSLHINPLIVSRIAPLTDLFLVDLKMMDTEKHLQYCGAHNELILKNIQLLAENGNDFVIRIPLIEGVNADERNITASAQFLSHLPWHRKEVQLLPYHEVAKPKHEKLGSIYNPDNIPMSKPSEEVLQRCIEIFGRFGISASTGG